MSHLIWDEETLPKLGRKFLRAIRDNMRFKESTVRLGITGEGIQPNYQVIFENGIIRTINGANHAEFTRTDEFDETKLSEPFTYEDILNAFNKT